MSAKRVFDIAVVVLSLPVSLPVLLILYSAVRFQLGSPAFFRQERAGYKGHIFRLWKFRTMTDARDAADQLLPDRERLTAFGRLLRSTSMDELPCLWNVLKGDMSLVGPRPLLVEYLPLYTPEQMRRHEVLPGITGWAQINGRNALCWEQKFALDVWYVDHRWFWLDVEILLLTVGKVLKRDGIDADEKTTMPRFTGSPPAQGSQL